MTAMAAETCAIIVIRQESISEISQYDPIEWLAECVLPQGHTCEEHIFKTPDGRYFFWKDDYECDCCEPDEEDRCYVYGEISESQMIEILMRG
jgi:hypothetical protein